MALLIEPLPTERDLRKLRWEKSNKKLNETSIVRKTLAGVASQKRRIPNGRVACRVSRVAWRGVAWRDTTWRGVASRGVARWPGSREPRHFPAIIEATESLSAWIPHRLQFVGWH